MDADLCKRAISSNNFGHEGKELRDELAQLARNVAAKSYDPILIQPFTSGRLIPLNKILE